MLSNSKDKILLDSDQYFESIFQYSQNYAQDINLEGFFGYPFTPILDGEQRLKDSSQKSVGYFSMEFGIAPSIYHAFTRTNGFDDSNNYIRYGIFSNAHEKMESSIEIDKILDIPIYGGGLGVLAGDALKSCADLNLSVVGVGVLWNKGYFRQRLGLEKGQSSFEQDWDPATYPGLVPFDEKVVVPTNRGSIYLRIWKYYIYSKDKKHVCPIILLDSDCEENSDEFRRLTDQLYR
ncbi:Glycogen phosphorylase, partial [hydrothermal vent metagenome]